MCWSGGIVGPLRRVLRAKGYNTVGAREIYMPSNMLLFYPDWVNNNIVYPWAEKRVEKYTQRLIKGKAKWREMHPISLSKIWEKERFDPKIWEKIRNRVKIDRSLCTGCKICVDNCPVECLSLDKDKKIVKNTKVCKSYSFFSCFSY